MAEPCVGYDALCVGSYEMNSGLTDPSDDTISSWSARGPGPLGVKKPDLVAPGDTVVAEEYYLANNRLWRSGTGTSFAAPLVSGAAILLAGSGITDHLAQKAILIDSARPGRADATAAMGTQAGWQPDWGWGELDLQAALAQRTNFVTGSVPGGSARFFKATTQSAGERATLTWDMRVTGWCNAANCSGQGSLTHTLTNLDLVQRDASTSAVQASSTSSVDSVEQVRSPGAGQVVYVVRAASSVDGLTAEPFALAAKSSLAEIKAPEPTLSASLSRTRARQGEPVTVTAQIANPSPDLAGQNAQASLILPAGVQLVSGSQTQTLGTLAKKGQSGDSATATWTVQGTTDAVSDLRVIATTRAYGEQLRSETSAGQLSVDSTPPTIALTAPSGTWNRTDVPITWSASDGGGSGVDHYDIEVQTGSGEWLAWLEPTTQTAATWPGTYGQSYSWRARAVDAMGNASGWTTGGPLALVDPTQNPDDVQYSPGGTTGTYTTTTWTPTSPTGAGTGTTTTTTRRGAGLRITHARIAHGYVILRGRLRAHASVAASARIRPHRIHGRATARDGRYVLRMRLPHGAVPRRFIVRVTFAGSRDYAPASARRIVRRS